MEQSSHEELIASLLNPIREKIEKHHIKFCSFDDTHFTTLIVGEQFDFDIAIQKAKSTYGFRSLMEICARNRILGSVISRSRSPIFRIVALIMNWRLKMANRYVDREIVTLLFILNNTQEFFDESYTPERIKDVADACGEMVDEIEQQLRSIHQS